MNCNEKTINLLVGITIAPSLAMGIWQGATVPNDMFPSCEQRLCNANIEVIKPELRVMQGRSSIQEKQRASRKIFDNLWSNGLHSVRTYQEISSAQSMIDSDLSSSEEKEKAIAYNAEQFSSLLDSQGFRTNRPIVYLAAVAYGLLITLVSAIFTLFLMMFLAAILNGSSTNRTA
ncbi:MAG: hypothetical protein HC852_11245 [Acaryochloridaceae cyanobacterium RU_4_10]|nr:hypothetical protein [Acaryochloridaceae cyanobacterium RU_4_10]